MYEQEDDILTQVEETEQNSQFDDEYLSDFEKKLKSQQTHKAENVFEAKDSQLSNDANFFDQVAPANTSSVSPTQQKETTSFVKSSYSTNNLTKTYKKYDVIQTYVPQKSAKPKQSKEFETFVTEQDSYVPERETVVVEKVEQKPTYKLNSKAKVWLVAIIAIFVMLGGLAIYNAVHISSLQNSIASTETNIKDVNDAIKKATKTLGKITDEETVMDKATGEIDMHQATSGERVTIELEQKNQVDDYQGQSNFFDEICNFVRMLFGGK